MDATSFDPAQMRPLHSEFVIRSFIDLGEVDYGESRHLGSQVAATTAIVKWFGELRRR